MDICDMFDEHSTLIKLIYDLAGNKSANNMKDEFEKLADLYGVDFLYKFFEKIDNLRNYLFKQVDNFYMCTDYSRRKINENHSEIDRKKAYKIARKNNDKFWKEIKEFSFDDKGNYSSLIKDIVEITYKWYAQYRYYPFFIRGFICLLISMFAEVVNRVNILATGEPRKTVPITDKLLKYLHDATVKRYGSTNLFRKEKGDKLLHDKWGLDAYRIFKYVFYPPEQPFEYAGHKDNILGFVIREMLEQVDYKEFVDAFAGSGRVLLQFPIEDDREYIVNDLHSYNYALFQCMKDKKRYKTMLKLIEDEQKKLITYQKEVDEVYKLYPNKNDKGRREKHLQAINDKVLKLYHKWYNNYINEVKNNIEQKAADFVLLHQFIPYGRPINTAANNPKLLDKLKKSMSWIFERDFKGMYQAYSRGNVEIIKRDGLKLVNIKNKKSTLLYLDPPYAGTAEYSKSFSNIKKLIDRINKSSCHYIYHCQSIYRSSLGKNKKEKEEFFKSLLYWKSYEDNCFVTIIIETKIEEFYKVKNATIKECLDMYLRKLIEQGGKVKSDQTEIVITNFKVSVDAKNYLIGDYSPYSVSLRNGSNPNKNTRIITVTMKQFLKEYKSLLFSLSSWEDIECFNKAMIFKN